MVKINSKCKMIEVRCSSELYNGIAVILYRIGDSAEGFIFTEKVSPGILQNM